MTSAVKLDTDEPILIRDCEYQFVRVLPSSNPAGERRGLQFVEIRTGYIQSLTHAEFDRGINNGDITLPWRGLAANTNIDVSNGLSDKSLVRIVCGEGAQ